MDSPSPAYVPGWGRIGLMSFRENHGEIGTRRVDQASLLCAVNLFIFFIQFLVTILQSFPTAVRKLVATIIFYCGKEKRNFLSFLLYFCIPPLYNSDLGSMSSLSDFLQLLSRNFQPRIPAAGVNFLVMTNIYIHLASKFYPFDL